MTCEPRRRHAEVLAVSPPYCTAAGVGTGEARRRAAVAFGGAARHEEALRDGRGVQPLAMESASSRIVCSCEDAIGT